MLKFITGILGRRTAALKDKPPLELGKKWTVGETVDPVKQNGVYVCPNCHGAKFFEGPSGGVSTNVECAQCHLRWNSNNLGLDWEYLGR